MTKSIRQTIHKATAKIKPQPEPHGLRKDFWLHLPLGFMALFSGYIFFFQYRGPLYLSYIWSTGWWNAALFFASLLTFIFCALFIYKYTKGYRPPLLAKLIAYFLVFASIFILYMAISAEGNCYSAGGDCSSMIIMTAFGLYFSHPLAAISLVTLLVIGIAILALNKNKSA